MTAPSSYILTSCQPFRPDNSPAISRRTLLTKQQNWKLSAEVSITTRSTTNWLCHWKAQLNTRGQTTELSTNQAEDQVPSLLYSSTFTSSPVISVHYKRVKLAKTSAQASGTTTTTSVPCHCQCCSSFHWLFKLLQSWVWDRHCCLSVVPNTAAASQTQLSKSSSLSCLTFSILSL